MGQLDYLLYSEIAFEAALVLLCGNILRLLCSTYPCCSNSEVQYALHSRAIGFPVEGDGVDGAVVVEDARDYSLVHALAPAESTCACSGRPVYPTSLFISSCARMLMHASLPQITIPFGYRS